VGKNSYIVTQDLLNITYIHCVDFDLRISQSAVKDINYLTPTPENFWRKIDMDPYLEIAQRMYFR
jgi:predicted nucleotidyltransferase